MIKIISEHLTAYIKKNDKETDIEIVQYGMELFVQEVTMFIFIALSAIILNLFFVVLVTIVGYSIIRTFANGAHAQNRIVCSISYITFIYGTIGFSFLIGHINIIVKIILLMSNILILYKYSPADTDDRPIISKKIINRNKYLSIISIVFIFIVAYAINPYSNVYSNVLIVISSLCSMLTLPFVYRIYSCKKSTGDYLEEEVKL